ncbi:hypothetical protein [Noviherbaspirillum malthae]|uniref:hypothetical protein n=1 Tax=Noviherbaspirillum malthae TaxID=1260987 RepID=UPI00188F2B8B|nr:hypothetical protein [Noviherbaspirillum malthae]
MQDTPQGGVTATISSMANKKSIYIGPELEEAIGKDAEITGLSHRINQIGDRYAQIMKSIDIGPRFSEAEWNLVRDSLNGTSHEPAAMIQAVWHGISDSIGLDQLDEKWEVDGPALLKKLQALSYVEQVALVEAVEQWWADK